jgi:heparan-alpha-glucosaminide N-acetyltransferase
MKPDLGSPPNQIMSSPTTDSAVGANVPSVRLGSLDAYRGLVMFLMMAEVLRVGDVARGFSHSAIWQFLAHHSDHVDWVGCTLHDLIQPSFSFLVGAALPYSLASRRAKGQTTWAMMGHAIWRSLVLIWLGIFLRSGGNRPFLNFTFEDTLTQIGLGYTFLFVIGLRSVRFQWVALGVILVGYWLAWAMYPLPATDFDYARVGVPPDWPHHATGFAAHWNKNSNLGAAFDQWFLNLFPRQKPFVANGGGYLTLSFIPTLGTMILGLIAGGWCRSSLSVRQKLQRFALAGVACLAAGLVLHWLGVCPIVKRIWTPSWTLFSGGWCFLLLGGFYTVVDVWGCRRCVFPLVVIGMNSIAIYCLVHLTEGFVVDSLMTCFGHSWPNMFGEILAPFTTGAAVLLVYWLILYWMYRRKLFLRI